MPALTFTCAVCGGTHTGSPSFGYASPWHYATLSAEQKAAWGRLSDDLCVIEHDEGTDYFIRTALVVPIEGVDEGFMWGVWISLSAQNFAKYQAEFDSDTYRDRYFGWLCNRLPGYPDTIGLKTMAQIEPGGQRPLLELEAGGHPLEVDFHRGISWARATEIFAAALHETDA